MILYVLKSPEEVKYGESLTEEEMARCESQTELSSPRWVPYPRRLPLVENICGKFVVRVEGGESVGGGGPGQVLSAIVLAEDAIVSASDIQFSGMKVSGTQNTADIQDSVIQDSVIQDSVIQDSGTQNTADTQDSGTQNAEDTCIQKNQNSATGSGDTDMPDLMEDASEVGDNESTPKHYAGPFYTSCLSDMQMTLDPRLRSVCFETDTPFGKQQEILHIDGHITARCTPGLPRSLIFKGAKGMDSINRLTRDLFLDQTSTLPLVHMGVISSCMGVRIQTSECCYLENRVTDGTGVMRGGWMTVEARTPDQCNIVRLSVRDWTGLLLPALIPVSNDVVITSRGSVVHRLAWVGLIWDEHVERQVLGACMSVVDAISSVC